MGLPRRQPPRSKREAALESALIEAVRVLRAAPKSEDGKVVYLAVSSQAVKEIAEAAAQAIQMEGD